MNNHPLLRARGPAVRAAHALHEQMNEVAAGVRELRAQSDPPPPPPAAGPGGEANPEAGRAAAPPGPLAPAPAGVTSVPAAVAWPPPAGPIGAAAGHDPRWPEVPNLQPELVAFVVAMQSHHEATAHALRQVTGLCHLQARTIDLLSREIEQLASRMRASYRMV